MLGLYRALMGLRSSEPALAVGDYVSVGTNAANVFAYRRSAAGVDSFLIVLNFGEQSHTLDLSQIASQATIVVATDMQRSGVEDLSNLVLRPNEGLVLRL